MTASGPLLHKRKSFLLSHIQTTTHHHDEEYFRDPSHPPVHLPGLRRRRSALAALPRADAAQRLVNTPAPPDISGVYEAIANGVVLAEGSRIPGRPAKFSCSAPRASGWAISPKDDPWLKCQPIGPFRMMAREHPKIEFAPPRELSGCCSRT